MNLMEYIILSKLRPGGGGSSGTVTIQDIIAATSSASPRQQQQLRDNLVAQIKLIAGTGITIDPDTGTISASGGGGSSALTAELIVSNELGRLDVGDVLDAGTEFESIFRQILTKVSYPTLVDPSVSMSVTLPSLVKVGTAISSRTLTYSFNRGSISPQYTADSPYRSGACTKFSLTVTNAATPYSVDLAALSSSTTLPEISRNSKGTVTITITATYEQGPQPKDSDGNNYKTPLAAGTKLSQKSVEFILPFYHGAVTSRDNIDLSTLTEDLSKKSNKTYSYTTNNQYIVFAYDADYGDLSSIIDQNGFETITGYGKTVLNYDGQRYNVYVSLLPTTDTGAANTFKF